MLLNEKKKQLNTFVQDFIYVLYTRMQIHTES